MPEAAFIVQLDDFQGFLVKKRHPSSLALTETILNLVFFEHQQGEEEEIRDSEIEGMRIASFTMEAFPGWTVCFVLDEDDNKTPVWLEKILQTGLFILIIILVIGVLGGLVFVTVILFSHRKPEKQILMIR